MIADERVSLYIRERRRHDQHRQQDVLSMAMSPRWCLVTKRICDCTEGCKKMKPRVKVKAKGIPIGSYEVIQEVGSKAKVKPKRKHRTLNQEYASRNKKRFKRVAK